ncbi:retrovirus-related pol polyprotein from transposon TNT 1-94 [Tanacetum coccineum]
MTTFANKAILSGADNHPPMLEKDMYNSWKSIMELYMMNRQHGRMILEFVQNGPLIWPMIKENGVTRPTKYSELTLAEAIQADCDVKATNIILQGLPPEEREYSGLCVPVFKQGDDPTDAINHMMSFLSAVITSRYPTANNYLRNSSNPRTYTPGASRSNSVKQRTIIYPGIEKGQATQTVITYNAAYQADDLDAYDFNSDEINTAKVALIANLSHYGSDLLAEVHNPDNIDNNMINQSVQVMPYSEQSSVVNRSETEITSDSNIIPYSQYVHETQQAAVKNSNSSTQQDAVILFVIEKLKTQVTNCTKINLDNKSVNDTLTAELERYKEQVKVLKEGQNIDLKSQDNVLDSCEESVEIDCLKQTLTEQLKEKESLKQTLEPKLYDGNVIKNTYIVTIPNLEETLKLAEESRSKMLLKKEDPMVLEKKVNTTPIDYAVLNQLSQDFEKQFVPQTELSTEQAFWSQNFMNSSDPSPSCRTTKVEVPKELPKVGMVNTSLKKLKHHLDGFDVVIKERTMTTAITEGSWGFVDTKACFRDEIIPFVKALKDIFNTFDQYLIDELTKVQNIFHQMEQAVDQHRLEFKMFEVKMNHVLNKNERLLEQIINKDIVNIVMNSSVYSAFMNMHECKKCLKLETELLKKKNFIEKETYNKLFRSYTTLEKHCISLEVDTQLNQEIFQRNNSVSNQSASSFDQYFELNELKAQSKEKDTVIRKLKERIKSLSGNMNKDKVKKDIKDIETINIELDHRVSMLIAENEHLKQTYNLQEKDLVITALKDELRKLKGKDLADNVEQAVILKEVVKQEKSQNPLNDSLDHDRVKPSTSASGSRPSGTTTVQHFRLNVNFELICVKCNGCMFSDNHDLCALKVINNVNARPKSKSVKKTSKSKVWKPTGKVFTKTGYTWRPIGQTFTIVGNACPLTRITTTTEVPPKKPIVLENDTPKPVVTLVYSRKPRKSETNVLVSKPKIIKSIYANNKELSKSWGSIVFDVPSSSLDECRLSKLFSVKFENDHVEKIMGYGDYQIRNVMISRVYYVEGLGHNLFYVGQFCDSNLEVTFRQHTYFIRNLEGEDLLNGSRGNNLHILSIRDTMAHGLVQDLPKLKFEKDHLCSTYAMGKSKKKLHKHKSEDTNQEKLYLLHMDLCGLMHVASVNGKKYILIIVDDYSQFTWVKCLRSKDEAPYFIIKFLKMIQVRLKIPVHRIRTVKGSEFINQTLHEYYEKVGISHETSIARSP